jgi:hypothetical protein
VLRLPVPSTDLLGRPVWEVSEEEVSQSSPCECESRWILRTLPRLRRNSLHCYAPVGIRLTG